MWPGLIPGWGPQIPQAANKKIKKKKKEAYLWMLEAGG